MAIENPVRKTTLFVVKKSKEVKINHRRIEQTAKEWLRKKIIVPAWPFNFHLKTTNPKEMLDYLIILDSINFCFWNKKKKWQINYKGGKYDGYFALSLSLKKFFEENPPKQSRLRRLATGQAPKVNLDYFSRITFSEFKRILQGGKNLQYLKKRWQIVRVVSSTLTKKYGNSEKFIKSTNKKLPVLIPKIQKELPYFDDTAFYKDKRIYFLKRAQILCSDIYGAFKGKGIEKFKDLDYLTCFTDYKVPQILHHLGILEYSPALEKKIKNKIIIPRNSNEEIEIRSATVWSVEYLKEELGKLGRKLHSFEIDWILWNKAQKIKIKIPYHLTKTIFY